MNARTNIPLDAIGDPLAPWNQPEHYEGIPHRCDWDCGTEVDEIGQVCDACLVDNAETCGDWDEESLAAKQRLTNTTTTMTTPLNNESALTRYNNATDIMAHAKGARYHGRQGYRASTKRMELAAYAMELLADEKNEEERGWTKLELSNWFDGLERTFGPAEFNKPNTLRKA